MKNFNSFEEFKSESRPINEKSAETVRFVFQVEKLIDKVEVPLGALSKYIARTNASKLDPDQKEAYEKLVAIIPEMEKALEDAYDLL